jgi:hypothetical protein
MTIRNKTPARQLYLKLIFDIGYLSGFDVIEL